MSKTETGQLSLRLDAISGPMSESKSAQNVRVLRDDELDAVSGGFSLTIDGVEIAQLKAKNHFIDASLIYGSD